MIQHPCIAAAQRLAELLEQENDALRTMDLARAASLVSAKSAALEGLNAASLHPPRVVDPSMAATVLGLDSLLRENRRLLERAITAQQRVIGIVVRAAAGARATKRSYGMGGRTSAVARPLALFTRA